MFLISVIFGFVILSSISKRIYGACDFVSNLITTILITFPIQIIAFTNAIYVSKYMYLIFLFSISGIVYFVIRNFSRSEIKSNISYKKPYILNYKNLILKVLSTLILILLLYKVFPWTWRFESHDLLYFSWLNGIFNLDYVGPIRYPTVSSLELASNHLTAGSVLLPFLTFLKINLVDTYTIKTLISIFAIYTFIDNLIKIINKESITNKLFENIIFLYLLIVLFFKYYSAEIYYLISISNYILFVIILAIGCECLYLRQADLSKKLESEKQSISRIFLLLILLATSKASTFPIVIITLIFVYFYCFNDKDLKSIVSSNFRKILFIGSLLMIFALIGWTIQESNHGTLDLSFPLCLITGLNTNACLGSIVENPFTNWYHIGTIKMKIFEILSFSKIIGLNEFSYIWFISILPSYFLGRELSNNSSSIPFKFFGIISKSYSLATAIGIVLIRSSYGSGGANTSHAYFIAPVFSFICICFIYLEKGLNNKINLFKILLSFILIPSLIITRNEPDTKYRRLMSLEIGPPNRVSATINELNTFNYDNLKNSMCTDNKFTKSKFQLYLDKNGCAKSDLKEIYSAVKGLKNKVSIGAPKSQVYEFSLKDSN